MSLDVRIEPTAQPPAELFVPTQREPLDDEVDREPGPSGSAVGVTRIRAVQIRATRKQPIAVAAVLISGLLGVVTIATLPEPGGATTRNAPSITPDRPLDDPRSTGGADSAVVVVAPGDR